MKYKSQYHIEGPEIGEQFVIGDRVRVRIPGVCCHHGEITHISSKGVYLDVGNKKDKYARFDQIDEIQLEVE